MKYDEVTISRQLETIVPVYVPDMSTPIGRLKHLRHAELRELVRMLRAQIEVLTERELE